MKSDAPFAGQPITRSQYISILQMAITLGEYRFTREAALAWLAEFPGDLRVRSLYVQVLLEEGRFNQAIPILESLVQSDPENLEALEGLYQARKLAGLTNPPETIACLLTLGSDLEVTPDAPDWWTELAAARQALQDENLPLAAEKIQQVLHAHTTVPLVGVTHLALLDRTEDTPVAVERKLATYYFERWPECLQCMLYLADWLMDGGEADQAVALLHRASACDVTGEVAARLWGIDHPYRSLWPDQLASPIELAVPASVAAALGWNQLSPGSASQPELEELPLDEVGAASAVAISTADQLPADSLPLPEWLAFEKDLSTEKSMATPAPAMEPETLLEVQAELERVARRLKRPGLTKTDGRFPVFVIMTVQGALAEQYGPSNTRKILREVNHLVEIIQGNQPNGRQRMNGRLFLVDDPLNLSSLGIQPVDGKDPWEIKLALADLDEALSHHGEMIGAVLIVGGPEIVPFHHLPNPVDDHDMDIPSDNPYATRDENYFIPEWPIGRLPGGGDRDPGLLLQQLQRIIKARQTASKPLSRSDRMKQRMLYWLRPERIFPNWNGSQYSFGYTAAVWRRASYQVFQPIGRPIDMWISPALPHHPNGGPRGDKRTLPLTVLGYFNLHGLPDAREWYGQRDPFDSVEGPDYPVALTPDDLDLAGRMRGHTTPKIVFSEACFGAHIEGKACQDSMALKFLAAGSDLVIGSTCMAYGSVTDHLSAADMLGFSFWNYIQSGLPAGEAFRRAKIQMARELQSRQGYLDGMDQKTLISFVFYGDPLTQTVRLWRAPKSVQRQLQNRQPLQTVCDLDGDHQEISQLSNRDQEYVAHVVSKYLPGMQDAQVEVHPQHAMCDGCLKECPTNRLRSKTVQPGNPPEGRRLVVLSKTIQRGTQSTVQFARMTLDPDGKIIKLVVSR